MEPDTDILRPVFDLLRPPVSESLQEQARSLLSELEESAVLPISLGQRLGNYTVVEALGPAVYRGEHLHLRRTAALKIISSEALATSLGAVRSLPELRHPNIVQVEDLILAEEQCWLVLEDVPGDALVDCEGLAPEAVEGLLRDLASALAFAHRQGVCHGAVSAEHCLRTADGRWKLCGFGRASACVQSDLRQLGALLESVAPAEAAHVRRLAGRLQADGFDSADALLESLDARPDPGRPPRTGLLLLGLGLGISVWLAPLAGAAASCAVLAYAAESAWRRRQIPAAGRDDGQSRARQHLAAAPAGGAASS